MKLLRYILLIGAILFMGYLFSPAIVSDGAIPVWFYVRRSTLPPASRSRA